MWWPGTHAQRPKWQPPCPCATLEHRHRLRGHLSHDYLPKYVTEARLEQSREEVEPRSNIKNQTWRNPLEIRSIAKSNLESAASRICPRSTRNPSLKYMFGTIGIALAISLTQGILVSNQFKNSTCTTIRTNTDKDHISIQIGACLAPSSTNQPGSSRPSLFMYCHHL